MPALVSAHVWSVPPQKEPPSETAMQFGDTLAEMAVTFDDRPDTTTGTALAVVELSPSSPEELSPQHITLPALVSAHAWNSPAEMAVTPEDRPETATGLLLIVGLLIPSTPYTSLPQHITPPALVSAHV
jgi:hypothetical protein